MIASNNFVAPEQLKSFSDIDGLKIIEELLLFKGVEVCTCVSKEPLKYAVSIRLLEDMTLIHYGLKSNPTNKLHVGFHLDKYYRRADLRYDISFVFVPMEIYNRVKEINDSYKNKMQ